jgi:hypothetical protein
LAGEGSVTWIDKFRALFVRFASKNIDFTASQFLALTLIKLRIVRA